MRAHNRNSNRLTYWFSGGAILLRGQPIAHPGVASVERARALTRFYSHEALACARKGDAEGARYCRAMAEELIHAVRASSRSLRATPRAAA